jgi:hypothetical protein
VAITARARRELDGPWTGRGGGEGVENARAFEAVSGVT